MNGCGQLLLLYSITILHGNMNASVWFNRVFSGLTCGLISMYHVHVFKVFINCSHSIICDFAVLRVHCTMHIRLEMPLQSWTHTCLCVIKFLRIRSVVYVRICACTCRRAKISLKYVNNTRVVRKENEKKRNFHVKIRHKNR